ncbi:hypothetical protein QZH41_005158 [Actinostola sp. cb2023]|nr:hypothetical protein QZH41_005158 [Actinostola sp. cb2023]
MLFSSTCEQVGIPKDVSKTTFENTDLIAMKSSVKIVLVLVAVAAVLLEQIPQPNMKESLDADLMKLLDETQADMERLKSDPQAWKEDSQAWREDPQAWKEDPQAWRNDPEELKANPQAWKEDPQAWKKDSQAWKEDPQAWKQDPQAWKQDPQAWKQDPQAWKQDPQAWKEDPQAWKEDPQAWKRDPQAWKQDPQAWKQDSQAWKQDPQAWKQDSQAWKQDPQAWKEDPQAWKEDPQAWKEDPQAWKEDPQAWKEDPQAWKEDPQAWKQDPQAKKKQARNVQVRLVGGKFRNVGRVEVLYRGRWGTVCDHWWSRNDANVVCRQLGYPKALATVRGARFGQGKGPIWMDNLRCTGTEKNLGMCRFNGWGKHNCRHSNDAGVVCQPKQQLRIYRLCEHHSGVLRCPVGKRIWVRYANYGRTTGRSVCPHIKNEDTEDHHEDAAAKVTANDHQDVESDQVQNDYQEDKKEALTDKDEAEETDDEHEVGQNDYQENEKEALNKDDDAEKDDEHEGDDSETDKDEAQKEVEEIFRRCEHKSGAIRCPRGRRIWVGYANYGRTTGRSVCPHRSVRNTKCRSSFSRQLTRCACHGRQSCYLYAKNLVYGDPCGGTFKYIEVKYKCVLARYFSG